MNSKVFNVELRDARRDLTNFSGVSKVNLEIVGSSLPPPAPGDDVLIQWTKRGEIVYCASAMIDEDGEFTRAENNGELVQIRNRLTELLTVVHELPNVIAARVDYRFNELYETLILPSVLAFLEDFSNSVESDNFRDASTATTPPESPQNSNFKRSVGDTAASLVPSKKQKVFELEPEVITGYIYELLETEANLQKIEVPFDAEETEARGFFFASAGAWEKEKLLILIHGTGVVRAGQWSRKYCESRLGGLGSESSWNHAIHVWEHWVSKSKASRIAIVAHSAGGYDTVKLADRFGDEFKKRVFAVCLTDSAHIPGTQTGWEVLKKVGRNWVTSTEPRDTVLRTGRNDVERVSAGVEKHEETSPAAIDSVFEYINEMAKTFVDSKKAENAVKSQESEHDVARDHPLKIT